MTARTLSHISRRWSEAERRMRMDLAACYRLADRFGFSDVIWNHITARLPGEVGQFLLARFGLRYDEVSASNLVKVDQEGNVLDGDGDINVTGYVIHSGIYTARQDVACVMHTHSPGGLAVSALECGLMPMVQDAMPFYERTAYHDYEGLSLDIDERERLAANLAGHDAMILRNHGLLTVGRSIGEAFMLMYYLERACAVQMQVLASGQQVRLPPADVCERAARQYAAFQPGEHEWPALVRMVDRDAPDYRE